MGSDEMLRITAGSRMAWFVTDNNDATKIVRVGGYRRGAGSNETGIEN